MKSVPILHQIQGKTNAWMSWKLLLNFGGNFLYRIFLEIYV